MAGGDAPCPGLSGLKARRAVIEPLLTPRLPVPSIGAGVRTRFLMSNPMTSPGLRAAAPTSSYRPPGPAGQTIDQDAAIGPHQVRIILDANAFGRPTSLVDEAGRYLWQLDLSEEAFGDLSEAEINFDEERPEAPAACFELDVNTQRQRVMTREEMMEHAGRDFGGSGALWLARVLAYDRWQIECLEAEARHKLPQLKARSDLASSNATAVAWLVLDKPATAIKDIAVKLGVFMLEIGEIELKEDDAKPLRRLCAELLALSEAPAI